jgi:hypothetical protein
MSAPEDMDRLLVDLLAGVEEAAKKFYTAGLNEGRKLATAEMAVKLSNVIGGVIPPSPPDAKMQPAGLSSQEDRRKRAPQGTIKPALLKALTDYQAGLSSSDLVALTGFKENTVRGTLRQLLIEGAVEKRGQFWAVAIKNEGPAIQSAEPS